MMLQVDLVLQVAELCQLHPDTERTMEASVLGGQREHRPITRSENALLLELRSLKKDYFRL